MRLELSTSLPPRHTTPQHRGDTGDIGLGTNLLTVTAVLVCSSAFCFLLALLVGVWVAYDTPAALYRFTLIAGGLFILFGIGWAGRERARTVLRPIGIGCTLVAAALGIAYVSRLVTNSGMVGSAIMVLVPLGFGGVWGSWKRGKKRAAGIGSGALLISCIGLIGSLERTAWIGLMAGVLCAGYLFWRSHLISSAPLRFFLDLAGVACLAIVLTVYWQLIVSPALDPLLPPNPVLNDLLVKRLPLWRESLGLIHDYPYTGSGLGSSAMVYSTYVYLWHVPYIYHAHALPLQIAVETGVPSLIAFAGITVLLLLSLVNHYERVESRYHPFYLSTFAAGVATLVYGFLDSELYATAAVPILFLPWGFALALHWAFHSRNWYRAQRSDRQFYVNRRSTPASLVFGVAGLAPLLAIATIFVLPGSLARIHHNLGAVIQTKAELSVYQWPAWPIQDEVRRSEVVKLAPAMRQFEAAISHNREDATAHVRLGHIALSQGGYERARYHLERAYAVASNRQTVRQLLAETYAVLGENNRSAALWRTINNREEHAKVRVWWYEHIGAEQAALQLGQAVREANPD